MSVRDIIEEKLQNKFSPNHLEVIDQSHKHKGHAGARPEGETHFDVVMQAKSFSGLNRVERQRQVYDCLSDELKGPIHALSLKLSD